jgi:hypothetical protein
MRRMTCVGHIARMVEMTNAYRMLTARSQWKDQSEDLGIDVIVLELVSGKLGGKAWTRCIWIRIWTSGGML